METEFNNYIRQYKLANTLEEKRALSTQFTIFYDSLSAEKKRMINQAMHPSLIELKAWTEQEIDPLLTRAEELLAKKVAV